MKFTQEELEFGRKCFKLQPESPWTAFLELSDLLDGLSLERMQDLYDFIAKEQSMSDDLK